MKAGGKAADSVSQKSTGHMGRGAPGGVVRASHPSRGLSKEVRGEVGVVAVARDEAPQFHAYARKELRNRT